MELNEVAETAFGYSVSDSKIDSSKSLDVIVTEVFIKTEMLGDDSNRDLLARSESFIFDNPTPMSSTSNSTSQTSRLHLKSPNGSSHKVSSQGLTLPHALGTTPKYLKKFQAKNEKEVKEPSTKGLKASSARAASFVNDTKIAKLRQMNSQTSFISNSKMQNYDTKNFKANKLPPWYKTPKSAKSESTEETPSQKLKRSVSSAPTDAAEKGDSKSIDVYLNQQAKTNSLKSMEGKKKTVELAKLNEVLRKKIVELEKALEEKNADLNVKSERLKALGTTMKNRREKSDNIASMEAQVVGSKKMIEDFQKENEKKDEIIQKNKIDIQRLKRDLDAKSKTCDILQSEKKNMEQIIKSAKRDQATESQIERLHDLEVRIQTRECEFKKLKREAEILADENASLKAKCLVDLKEECLEVKNQKKELTEYKKIEQELQQELRTLRSKLEDENHKVYRNENLLQLRGEYIKTLQDTDEVNKARLILQAKEIEDLTAKLGKAKKFKSATQEDLSNLHNTLKSQEFEILNLKRELESKNFKIIELKERMKK